MRLCRAGRGGRTRVVGVVRVFVVRVSVVEGWRRQGTALVVVRVVVSYVGRVRRRGVVRRVASVGGSMVRIHGTVRRTWKRAARHGLRASEIGPRRHVTSCCCVRMHVAGGLGVVRVAVVRVRVVRIVAGHGAKVAGKLEAPMLSQRAGAAEWSLWMNMQMRANGSERPRR